MDVTTAREIAAALVVFGATGTVSTTAFQLALKLHDVDLLPAARYARVRWWRGHLTAAAGTSTGLLLLGLLGLLVL